MSDAMLDVDAMALAGSRTRVTSLMLVEFSRRSLLCLAPGLDRDGIELVEGASAEAALEQCARRRFELLVIRHPVEGMSVDQFLARLRDPAGRSHRAFALIVTETIIGRSLEALHGERSRFVNTTDFDQILSIIAHRILGVAPRVEARVMVRLGLRLAGKTMTRFCQVSNLSESGMLVRIAERPEIGDSVDLLLNLPSVPRPLNLRGEVVRHSGPREIEGIALRFVGLDRETRGHLRSYVRAQRGS